MQKPNIYLDIDGVILANEDNLSIGAEEFIKYAVENFDVYWLTTHCRDGNPEHAISYIMETADATMRPHFERFKPTQWYKYKTEAIDFSKPFLWFDDDCYLGEKEMLKSKDVYDSWIEVDLRKYPDQLQHELKLLQSIKEK